MRVRHCDVAHEDERGAIRDICTTPIDRVSLITAKQGSVRGNHYHTKATVYVYVLSGSFRVASTAKDMPHLRTEPMDIIAKPGDLLIFPPYDLHALKAIEDSSFIIMAKGKRGGTLTVREILL